MFSEVDDPPSDILQKINSSLMLQHNACVIYLTSSYHNDILSSHIITGKRVYTVQSGFLRERERGGGENIQITFITVWCYNFYVLL